MRTLILLYALACGGCASSADNQSSAYTLYADIPALVGSSVVERVYIATFDAEPAESARMGGNLSSPADCNRHFCERFASMAMQQDEPPRRAWCENGSYRRSPR